MSGSSSPKYHHESTSGGGQDNFTDFVTLVCQTTTTQESAGGSGRSPAKVVSYYTAAPAATSSTAGLYPAQPMARPVSIRIQGAIRTGSDKGFRMLLFSLTLSYSSKIKGYYYLQRVSPPLKKTP